jgi:hypothetical protein
MKIFEGERTAGGVVVTMDGSPLADTAPDLPGAGFEWGYRGAEPLRLAHALIEASLGPDMAVRHREALLVDEIMLLDNWWRMTDDDIRALVGS